MIGALIRNSHTWKHFFISDGLVNQATLLIESYLDGEEVLFGPALLAWQFLLTYEQATRERGDEHVSGEHVSGVISRIYYIAGSRKDWWFLKFAEILRVRTGFHNALPQQAEIFMGLKGLIFPDVDIQRFSILVQMNRFFINTKFMSKTKRSPYLMKSYAEEVERAALPILLTYGVTPQLWREIRDSQKNAQVGLSKEAIDYLDAKFSNISIAFKDPSHRAAEDLHSKELAKWLPFSSLDEEQFSLRYWKSFSAAFVAFTNTPFEDLWQSIVVGDGTSFAKSVGIDPPAPHLIIEKARQIVGPETLVQCGNLARRYYDRARQFVRTVSGWTPLTEKSQEVAASSLNRKFQKIRPSKTRARPLSRQSGVEASLQMERTMQNKAPPSHVDVTVQELFLTVERLDKHPDGVIRLFLDAFEFRKADQAQSESRPGIGLAMALSSILIRAPADEFLQSDIRFRAPKGKSVGWKNLSMIREALDYLVQHEPDVIEDSCRIQKRLGISFTTLLHASFLQYYHEREFASYF
jgi:hypothetical protein